MMGVRLLEMRRVLAPTGSIYLHCDPTASHYLKLLMDAVFGIANFRNEIIWHYRRWTGKAKRFQRLHDCLLFYTLSDDHLFNVLYDPYTEKSLKRKQNYHTRIKDGEVYVTSIDERGVRAGDVWQILLLNSQSKERTGYPTQKPLALLERIIQASSNPGNVVLDPFCGCATACVAADNLQREWIGIDISPKAVELVHIRLRHALGGLYHAGMVTTRTDIPQRTDIEAPIPYRLNKHVLFGQQEGLCAGCRSEFPFRAFEVDHVIPQSRGGTDHIDNLQLLCSSCNRIKGNRSMEYLMARLAEFRQTA